MGAEVGAWVGEWETTAGSNFVGRRGRTWRDRGRGTMREVGVEAFLDSLTVG